MHLKEDDAVTPWGEGANLGNLDKKDENKPKRKYNRKPKAETSPDDVQTVTEEAPKADEPTSEGNVQPAADAEKTESVQAADETVQSTPKKRKNANAKKDPWSLSATTLNQKYTLPSGKERNLEAVDESKVGVGGITFSKQSGVFDPFGDVFDVSAMPENGDEEDK